MLLHKFREFYYIYDKYLDVALYLFNCDKDCSPGGLYCTTEEHIDDFSNNDYVKNIYEVRLPDEAIVFIEGPNKLKSDMLEIIRKLN